MAYNVTISTEKRLITIKGKEYTLRELEAKNKSRIEVNIFNTAKQLFDTEPVLFEPDDFDLRQLVESDMFKGDNHSQALLQ